MVTAIEDHLILLEWFYMFDPDRKLLISCLYIFYVFHCTTAEGFVSNGGLLKQPLKYVSFLSEVLRLSLETNF